MGTMKKILITGGLGFIFSYVTEHYIKLGFEVHVIDNLSAGSHPELRFEFAQLAKKHNSKFYFHLYDVSFGPTVSIIETLDPDYIIHAAAISDVDYSIRWPAETIQANNQATINVFEAARKCPNLKKLLYVSTDEVYGECDHPKTEEEILFPKNPYAVSKAFGSILRLAYDNTYGELKNKTVETRFCNVFGPRQDARKILPAIKRAYHGGDPVVIHNGGKGYRQFIHVEEIPPIIELLLEKGTRTYNITTNEGYTVNELLSYASWYTKKKKIPTIEGTRSGMDMRYEMSNKRLVEEFNWRPAVPFTYRLDAYLNEDID